ncbi:MAG: S8 family serine peptidase [Kofleriaceae bacterium]
MRRLALCRCDIATFLANDKQNEHGTSVAAIAAGNGIPAACCSFQDRKFAGVAPEADIAVIVPGPDLVYTDTRMSRIFEFINEHTSKS